MKFSARVRQASSADGLAHFLIHKFAESMIAAVLYTDPVLGDIMRRIDEVRFAHGLEDDEDWRIDEGPPEWQELNRQWDVAADALTDSLFQRNGVTDMTSDDLRLGDPALRGGEGGSWLARMTQLRWMSCRRRGFPVRMEELSKEMGRLKRGREDLVQTFPIRRRSRNAVRA